VQRIPCRKALLVTGTPVKNRPEELFTQLHFLDPQSWPDRNIFINQYYPEDSQVTDKGRVIQNVEPCNLASLNNELASTVLVRANKERAGLPPKHFEQILIPPFDLHLQDIVWLDSKTLQMFLTGIKLRDLRVRATACADPDIKAELWAEVRRLEDKMHQLGAAVRCHVGDIKAPAVLGYLLTLTEKTLVICHHLHILDQLEQALKRAGKGVVVHSGKHDSPTGAVKAFQEDHNVQFFIGQAMAASLSLTLTAAHHVVFAELPPTRADFDQAVDRLHRIGQKDDVLVTVFTIDYLGSGDPARLSMMHRKKTIADQILDMKEEGGGW
jgi:SNF2 family DNA or RNA helicase